MQLENQTQSNDLFINSAVVGAGAQVVNDNDAAITKALQTYGHGFLNAEYDTLVNLWDADYGPQITYVAVEFESPLFGLDSLKSYYKALIEGYTILSFEMSDIQIRYENGDSAYTFCFIDWKYQAKQGGPVLTFRSRTTTLLRKRGGKWLYHQMHESEVGNG